MNVLCGTILVVLMTMVIGGCRFAMKDFVSSVGSIEAETKEVK